MGDARTRWTRCCGTWSPAGVRERRHDPAATEARVPRAVAELLLGQWARHDLSRAPEGAGLSRPRHRLPRTRRALVRGPPGPAHGRFLPARILRRPRRPDPTARPHDRRGG